MPKREQQTYAGTAFVPEEPNWERFREAICEWLLGQFMAMHEVQLKNGPHVCAYKHIDTRRYLHIDKDLNAFEYIWDDHRPSRIGRYEPISLDEAFARVLLLPSFNDGWIEGGRWARPGPYDEEGNEIEDERWGFFSYFEERMAYEAWSRLRRPFELDSGVVAPEEERDEVAVGVEGAELTCPVVGVGDAAARDGMQDAAGLELRVEAVDVGDLDAAARGAGDERLGA